MYPIKWLAGLLQGLHCCCSVLFILQPIGDISLDVNYVLKKGVGVGMQCLHLPGSLSQDG